MSIEVLPMGVTCNLSCSYCYQHPIRDAGNMDTNYDVAAMQRTLAEEGGAFTLFGGEALLTRKVDLETLWAWGLERFGSNGLQTNGVLIDDEHVRMFQQYKVGVGFSMDGPAELNDSRWAGSTEKTREATAKSQANLERLCRDGCYRDEQGNAHPPSLIVTLHRGNATAQHRPRLKAWLRDLEAIGLRAVRLHPLEIDHHLVGDQLALTTEEMVDVFLDFHAWEKQCRHLRFDVFEDIRRLMRGDDRNVTCTWNACDPWTTEAVRGVDGQGGRSNCGRTNKEGIDLKKADRAYHERQLGLAAVPMDLGGCGGCRFWSMCKGQCPGTGEGQDWRRKTDECALWMALFEMVEREMTSYGLTPLSLDPRRDALERAMADGWGRGEARMSIHATLASLAPRVEGKSERVVRDRTEHGDVDHGDHDDHGDSDAPTHGDSFTESTQHADETMSHGDHTDAANPWHGDSV